MDPDLFLADVLAEPDALAGVLEAHDGPGAPLAALPPLDGRRVLLLGMGSSRYAALPAAAALRRRGVHAVAEHASHDVPTPPHRDLVVIAISASGRSPETLAALAPHRGVSTTVALTNHPDRELAGMADHVVPMACGPEEGGVSSRSFQATVAILHRLAGVPTSALRPAVASQRELLDAREDWLPELLHHVEGADAVQLVAPASRIASALEGALMLREGPRVRADPSETGDWCHVDVYLSRHPGYTAILFGGSPQDQELLGWTGPRGGRVAAVGRAVAGTAPHVPFARAEDPLVASLVETSAIELLAATWWRRRIDAGAMP